MRTEAMMSDEAKRRAELERCEREIAAMECQHDAPAFLVTLGVEDWRGEQRLIEKEGGEKF